MDPIRQQLVAEAQRRFGGLGASSSGIGAPAANNPSTMNPMAARGMLSGQQPPNTGHQLPPAPGQPRPLPANSLSTPPATPPQGMPPMPTQGNPNAGAIGAMQGAQPGGAKHIEKALINRMMQYPPQ